MRIFSSFLIPVGIMLTGGIVASCSEDILSGNTGSGNQGFQPSIAELHLHNFGTTLGPYAPAPVVRKAHGNRRPVYSKMVATDGVLRYGNGRLMDPSQDNAKAVPGSRASIVTAENFHDDFGLFTFEYDRSSVWQNVSTTQVPLAYNEHLMKTKKWITDESWPGENYNEAFFAYAPYNPSGVSLSDNTVKGTPQLHYVVPGDVHQQTDLCISEPKVDIPGNTSGPISLQFHHRMSAVRVAIGKQMAPCTIRKIQLQGVYSTGDISFGKEDTWQNVSVPATFTLTKDYEVNKDMSYVILTTDNDIFMMLPQTVPAGAKLIITVDDGGGNVRDLWVPIGGNEWKMGYTNTYYFSTSSTENLYYTIVATAPTTTVPGAGGTVAYTVQSLCRTYYGREIAVPWNATYTIDDDKTVYETAQPHGVRVFTPSGIGSITGENVSLRLDSIIGTPVSDKSSTYNKTLKENPSYSTTMDLAKSRGTANCYVINTAGTYTFPLVYGNGVNADGTENKKAYTGKTFVDYMGQLITSPYIYNKYTPKDAIILWQDAPNLITPSSVKLTADKHSIEFTINRSNICQGNAVIAVRDTNNVIMWSWHIWVTGHKIDPNYAYQTNNGGGKFMEVPLGYVDPETRVSPVKRVIHLKIKQDNAKGDSAMVTINQDGITRAYGASVPYYQFGRKDPFPPSDGLGNNDKPLYDVNLKMTTSPAFVQTYTTIREPTTFFYTSSDDDWSTDHDWNMWNYNLSDAAAYDNTYVGKTIYDPSPAGFKLPFASGYAGCVNGYVSSTSNPSGFNVNTNSKQIFLGIFGYRDKINGKLDNVNAKGYYWTSGASSTKQGRYHYFSLSYDSYYGYTDINPAVTASRAFGFPVSCVVDE